MSLPSTARRVLLLLTGGLFARTGFAHTVQGDGQRFSAREILERMAGAYAKCATYQDSGCVTTTTFEGDTREHEETLKFSTAFVRPSQFRFKFTSNRSRRFLVVANGADTQTWWDVQPGVKSGCTLEVALAGATGISGGAAHTVPSLLMPERVGGLRLTQLIDLRRLQDARLAEVDCFRIEGVTPFDRSPELQKRAQQEVRKITGKDLEILTNGPSVYWIDQSTFLLRRIDQSAQNASTRIETATTYDPRLDVAITDSQLAFDP